MEVPPNTDELHPALADVATQADLTALLNRLRIRAGKPSARALETKARSLRLALSKSTAATIINSTRYPTREALVAFVRSCGVPADEVKPWTDAWERLADSGMATPPVPANQEPSPTGDTTELQQLREQVAVLHAELAKYRTPQAEQPADQPPEQPTEQAPQQSASADTPRAEEGTAMFRGAPDHRGVYRLGTTLPADWKPWAVTTSDFVDSSPVVAGGTVFVASSDRHLYAVDAATGQVWWKTETGTTWSSPAVIDGTVFAGSQDGHLCAVDAATGQVQWKAPTGGPVVSSSPAVAGGVAYIGDGKDNLCAVDAATGQLLWTLPLGGKGGGFSSPAVAGGVVFVGGGKRHLFAVDAATGQLHWKIRLGGHGVLTSPAVAGRTVFMGTTDKHLYAVDAGTGHVWWKVKIGAGTSSPAVVDGVVYIGGDRHLHAVDAESGRLRWKTQTRDSLWSSPAVAGGVVYVGSLDGCLYAVGAESGQVRWKVQTAGPVFSSPAVADGVVFVGSRDKHLYAIDAATGQAVPPPGLAGVTTVADTE